MITPLIEKLILAGLADFRSFNIGGSSSSQLFTGNDKTTLMVGFLYNDFLWNYSGNSDYIPDYHVQVIFTDISRKTSNVYTINPRPRSATARAGGANSTFQNSGEPIHIPCFHLFEGSIQIEIVGGNIFNDPVNFGAVNPQVANLTDPIGTRGGPVARYTLTSGNIEITHNGPNDPILGANSQFEYRIGTDSLGGPPWNTLMQIIDGFGIPGKMVACPAITLQLVQINTSLYKRLAENQIRDLGL